MASLPMNVLTGAARTIVDFALPPRCAGCSEVIEDVHAFCGPCWSKVEWLGQSGCEQCGLPLEGTQATTCARCLAEPPTIERMRAATAYGDLTRSVALRLKYGRKVALARTMARYMAPLREPNDASPLVVPVPLHRWRLWGRGFNQAGLVAAELGRRWDLPVEQAMLKRVKRTAPLKGMSLAQRRQTVGTAFAVAPGTDLRGRSIILVDDVMTTGSTAEGCAKALRKAGAGRIELICWTRVVRHSHLMR
ncbi:ComF family protein [Sphingomonas sp. LY160]|uniref:ComF family protein n=1 Tax=Sphingomonas sp. LY160 TaxID=3095342 RepID=UPI002ADED769|nr:ComF family protein [Sphingomonas sp. LY160]MEA1073268.1 ComF family protein [Sphingomonas sp. LY160]